MKLDNFLNLLLDELDISPENIKSIKDIIKQDYSNDYDKSKIEFSLAPTEKDIEKNLIDNRDLDISIKSDGYDDGNIIFVDCYLSE